MKKIVSTNTAPAAAGPYSQAVKTGGMLYLSGQIPLDPASGTLVEGGIAAQTRRVCENISAVLASEGLNFDHAIKCTVFLTDMGNFAEFNAVYREYFTAPYPARSCVAVAALPMGAAVEIEVTASYE